MDPDLVAVAKAVEEASKLLEDVGRKVDSHTKSSANVHADILRILNHANERIEELHQRRMLDGLLLTALVEQLVSSEVVDGGAVSERFLSTVQSLKAMFDRTSLAQAKMLAEQISHPGFPDEMPKPRGLGPTLIVDNDQSDS